MRNSKCHERQTVRLALFRQFVDDDGLRSAGTRSFREEDTIIVAYPLEWLAPNKFVLV